MRIGGLRGQLTPIILAVTAVTAGLALAVYPVRTAPRPPEPTHERPEYKATSSRVSLDQIDALVGPAITAMENNEVAKGLCLYEASLRDRAAAHGAESLEVADTIVYFGAEQSRLNHQARAIGYFEEGLVRYRKLFGAGSPEVALVHMDLARNRIDAYGDGQLDKALADAQAGYDLMLKAKGAANPETAFALSLVAGIKGRPALTGGDPAKIQEANALFATSVRTYLQAPFDPRDVAFLYFPWVKMLVQNGQDEAIWQVLDEANRLEDGPFIRTQLLIEFRDNGRIDLARAIARRYDDRDIGLTPQAPLEMTRYAAWPDDLDSCPAERRPEFGL